MGTAGITEISGADTGAICQIADVIPQIALSGWVKGLIKESKSSKKRTTNCMDKGILHSTTD